MSELDPKALLEQLLKSYAAQTEYFTMLAKITKQKPYTEIVNKNLLKFSMIDQVELMKAVYNLGCLSKKLCDKYGLEVEEEL